MLQSLKYYQLTCPWRWKLSDDRSLVMAIPSHQSSCMTNVNKQEEEKVKAIPQRTHLSIRVLFREKASRRLRVATRVYVSTCDFFSIQSVRKTSFLPYYHLSPNPIHFKEGLASNWFTYSEGPVINTESSYLIAQITLLRFEKHSV